MYFISQGVYLLEDDGGGVVEGAQAGGIEGLGFDGEAVGVEELLDGGRGPGGGGGDG
jgi:hypothetical protein